MISNVHTFQDNPNSAYSPIILLATAAFLVGCSEKSPAPAPAPAPAPSPTIVSVSQIAASENIPTQDTMTTTNLSSSWLVRIIVMICIIILLLVILSLTPTLFTYNIPFLSNRTNSV
jgi:hypothetical protein